jgi:leucyl aminopeptidase
MEFTQLAQLEKRKKADVLILPFWKDQNRLHAASPLEASFVNLLAPALTAGDFKAKEGEMLFLYMERQPEKRVALLGLGSKEEVTVESLRRAFGSVTKTCLSKKLKTLNVVVPQSPPLTDLAVARGMSEGLLLPNYQFNRLKNSSSLEEEGSLLEKINWIGGSSDTLTVAEKTLTVCDGVYYTRDLVNGNADDVTPQYLALCAQGLAKEQPAIKTTIFDKKRLEKEQMHLILAVNRGASSDPVLIQMEYKGNPESSEHTVLIGKGVTYDTGGLNLKPTGGMETMKCDMAGGAVCFGVILAVAQLQLKVNLTVLIPSTENAIDANSFKPGDVYPSYAGINVEMTNSDAEGRLILADALAYASKKLKPTCLLDIATLTGAIEVALGSEASGIFSTQDLLSQLLIQAGDSTYERLWRMPLYEEYKERLKSDIADLKSWNGRSASSSVAAVFLKQFVDNQIPWAHLDIAGTAFVSEAKKYLPKYSTGFGVRLIVEFLEQLASMPAKVKATKQRAKSVK